MAARARRRGVVARRSFRKFEGDSLRERVRCAEMRRCGFVRRGVNVSSMGGGLVSVDASDGSDAARPKVLRELELEAVVVLVALLVLLMGEGSEERVGQVSVQLGGSVSGGMGSA